MVVKQKNTFLLPRCIFDKKYRHLTPSARVVYLALAYCASNAADRNGWFPVGDKELASVARRGVMTVQRAKKALNDAGLIEIKVQHALLPDGKKTEHHVTHYHIIDL